MTGLELACSGVEFRERVDTAGKQAEPKSV